MLDETVQPEPTIPPPIKSELTDAAKTVAKLPQSSTLRSGQSTLPIPGTPARRDVQDLGLEVTVHPDAPKIKRPAPVVKTGK